MTNKHGEYRVTCGTRIMGLPRYRIELVLDGQYFNVCPSGDTPEELRQDIENMTAALHKPVLHIDE